MSLRVMVGRWWGRWLVLPAALTLGAIASADIALLGLAFFAGLGAIGFVEQGFHLGRVDASRRRLFEAIALGPIVVAAVLFWALKFGWAFDAVSFLTVAYVSLAAPAGLLVGAFCASLALGHAAEDGSTLRSRLLTAERLTDWSETPGPDASPRVASMEDAAGEVFVDGSWLPATLHGWVSTADGLAVEASFEAEGEARTRQFPASAVRRTGSPEASSN